MWAHALVDSGATVYVSHGDPRLQGIELYNGCPIFYCLGSFIFQTKTEIGFYGPEVWQSCIASLEYHSHNTTHTSNTSATTQAADPQRQRASRTAPLPSPTFSIRLTPLTLNEVGVPPEPVEMHYRTRGLPSVAVGEEGRRILRHVAAMSAQFGTVVEVEESEDGSVVGWVTGVAGAVRVGERADPTTVGAMMGEREGGGETKHEILDEQKQVDVDSAKVK